MLSEGKSIYNRSYTFHYINPPVVGDLAIIVGLDLTLFMNASTVSKSFGRGLPCIVKKCNRVPLCVPSSSNQWNLHRIKTKAYGRTVIQTSRMRPTISIDNRAHSEHLLP